MAVQLPPLESLRSAVHQDLGIREVFLLPDIGARKTVAVLSTPLDGAATHGWVVCHSFGAEQVFLQPLEVAAARSLAARGFAVLRFHGQGYGDSEGDTAEISLDAHVRDAVDATAALASTVPLEAIGLIGGSLGGAVAAVAADRVGASSLVMWEPVVSGSRFIQRFIRAGLVTELASRGVRPADDDPFPGSGPDAVLDVQGFPLRRAVYEQFLAFDLLHELKAFRGRSLVVQLSATPRRRPDLQRLVAALASLGGASTLEVVVDPQAGLFAQPRYRSHAGRKEDTQRGMSDRIISATLAWCGGSELGAHGGEERRRA